MNIKIKIKVGETKFTYEDVSVEKYPIISYQTSFNEVINSITDNLLKVEKERILSPLSQMK